MDTGADGVTIDAPTTMYIGESNIGGQQALQRAQMDDLLIFKRALSADEVSALYSMSKNGERFSPAF